MTDYLAGLVARGLGRAPGPALEPRLAPEIDSVPWQPPAAEPVEPAPAAAGQAVEDGVSVQAPRRAPIEPVRADPPPAGEARQDPPRVEGPRGRRRSRAAEPAAPHEGRPKAETAAAQAADVVPAAVRADVRADDDGGKLPPAPNEPARRPEMKETVSVAAVPASPSPPAEEGPVARPLVELLPREPAERPVIPAAPAPALPHVEVRIGRVEVRAPRAPEPWRPVEPAPLRETPADPFVGLAAARRYVDRAWR